MASAPVPRPDAMPASPASTLKTRVLTALAMFCVFAAVFLVLPPPWFAVAMAVAVAASAWEWSRLCLPGRPGAACAYALFIGSAALAFHWQRLPQAPLLALAVLLWCLAPLLIGRWHGRAGVPRTALVLGFFVLVPAYLAIVALRGWAGGRGDYLWVFLLLVWAADIGAYFVGRSFGRRRLVPRVSPGKTWEGLGGGLASAAAVGVAALWLFPGGVPMAVVPWIAVCVATALFSVIGDLTESLLKRMAGVKDSGVLLPGHGGLLDRFDGIFAAAPLFAVAIWMLQSTTTETLW